MNRLWFKIRNWIAHKSNMIDNHCNIRVPLNMFADLTRELDNMAERDHPLQYKMWFRDWIQDGSYRWMLEGMNIYGQLGETLEKLHEQIHIRYYIGKDHVYISAHTEPVGELHPREHLDKEHVSYYMGRTDMRGILLEYRIPFEVYYDSCKGMEPHWATVFPYPAGNTVTEERNI